MFKLLQQNSRMRAQLCLILWDPMDCSPPGSSIHGIPKARILGWVAIFFSRGSYQPRDWTRVSWVSCIVRWILYCWAIGEAQVSPSYCSTFIFVVLLKNIFRLKHHRGKSDNFLVSSGETSVLGRVWEQTEGGTTNVTLVKEWLFPARKCYLWALSLKRSGEEPRHACQVCHINRNADVTARLPSDSLPSWKKYT